MDRDVHARFLQYREAFAYFALGEAKQLTREEFEVLDAEHRVLRDKGDKRSDEDEARFEDLSAVLFRD
jgi:hypothetical protein